jgi:hypothetical protein
LGFSTGWSFSTHKDLLLHVNYTPPALFWRHHRVANAKLAWDTIKMMRVGVDRVREARRQRLRKDFDALAFQSGETVEDFSLRVSSLVTEL